MFKLFTNLTALSACLLLVFCDAKATDNDSFEVPVLVALTGQAAAFGSEELNAYTLAVEEWNTKGGLNGKPIKLKVEDTTSSNVGTLSALRHLMTQPNTKVVLGPTWADTFQGAIPVAVRSGLLLITPSAEGATIDQSVNTGPALITTYPSTKVEIQTLFRTAFKDGARKFAVITEEEPFSLVLRQSLLESATGTDAKIVLDKTVSGGTTDFRSLLLKAKQLKADSFFLFVFTEASVTSLLKQQRELLPEIQLYGIHDILGYLGRDEFTRFLNGVRFTVFKIRDAKFVDRYNKRFGHDPYLTAPQAYDTINIYLTALSNGNVTPPEVRSYILNSEHNTASYGPVKFTPDGRLNTAEVGIQQIHDGKAIPLP